MGTVSVVAGLSVHGLRTSTKAGNNVPSHANARRMPTYPFLLMMSVARMYFVLFAAHLNLNQNLFNLFTVPTAPRICLSY